LVCGIVLAKNRTEVHLNVLTMFGVHRGCLFIIGATTDMWSIGIGGVLPIYLLLDLGKYDCGQVVNTKCGVPPCLPEI
jgi:hypothetical protein